MRIQAEGLLRASEDQQAADGGANEENMAKLTSEELLARLIQEMVDLQASGCAGMRLDIPTETAFAIAAMCQLSLRHPALHGRSVELAREFIKYVEGKFRCHAPAVAEAIRRGNDPQYDVPGPHARQPLEGEK